MDLGKLVIGGFNVGFMGLGQTMVGGSNSFSLGCMEMIISGINSLGSMFWEPGVMIISRIDLWGVPVVSNSCSNMGKIMVGEPAMASMIRLLWVVAEVLWQGMSLTDNLILY